MIAKLTRLHLNTKTNSFFVQKKLKKLIKLIKQSSVKILVYVLLIEFAFVFIFPYIYMIVNSIKSPLDFIDASSVYVVKYPTLKYYKELMDNTYFNYGNLLKYTIFSSVTSALGQVISCSFAAYGLARFKFPGRKIIYVLIILTLIIPPQIFLIPLFLQFSKIGLMDTFLPIIGPSFLAGGLKGSLFILIFIQSYLAMPKELEESARIDGCGAVGTFWKIIFPNIKPAILVTAILSILWHWNDYFEPTVYFRNPNKYFLASGFTWLSKNGGQFYMTGNNELVNPIAMAAAVLVLLPLIVMYLIMQKRFMESVEHTGMK